jgi:hypothetical protein
MWSEIHSSAAHQSNDKRSSLRDGLSPILTTLQTGHQTKNGSVTAVADKTHHIAKNMLQKMHPNNQK